MKKSYCIVYSKYRKFKNLKTSYIFEKTVVLCIVCSKCKNEDEKMFKEEESVQLIKYLGLIKNI